MPIQEFKCPNCGGAIQFNPGTQEMVCPYCNSVISTEAFDFIGAESEPVPDEQTVAWDYDGNQWFAEDMQGMVVYSCNSCGGEIVGEQTLGASTCPFCGSPVVVTAVFSGALRPDVMIPFKLDKQAALDALEKHYAKKRLLPDVFKKKNHLNEVKGVYVPFWLYDTNTEARMEYRAQRVRYWSDRNYSYTETSHFRIIREGTLSFNAVPADGSEKADDDLMESIEPYDTTEVTDFNTAYLAGFYANKYDYDAKQCSPRVNERVKKTTSAEFAKTVTGYTGVRSVRENMRVNCRGIRYALLPVWILGSTWEGRNFVFAMNGQTGKFVGDLPLDKKKRMRLFWLIFAAVAAGLLLLTQGYIALFM